MSFQPIGRARAQSIHPAAKLGCSDAVVNQSASRLNSFHVRSCDEIPQANAESSLRDFTRFVALAMLLLLSTNHASAARFAVVHSFGGGPNDGVDPDAGVTIAGDAMYGSTSAGGINNRGALFRLGLDGDGYEVIHQFLGGATDGDAPRGELLLSGSTLYGMTSFGGPTDRGTIFKINMDGTGFQLLHSFAGGANDGERPSAGLILDGQTIYGTTVDGGPSNNGTIFRMSTDGSGFQLLHSFAGGTSDGSTPASNLTQDGQILYGTTSIGGANNDGTVFKIDKSGSGFELMHSFLSGPGAVEGPGAAVTLVGATLYGTTHGKNLTGPDNGSVFKMNTDGSGFQTLHAFAGGDNDGINPNTAALVDGSTVFGATTAGGPSNFYHSSGAGVIYRMNVNGSGYELLHRFAGSQVIRNDGSAPYGNLALNSQGTRVYGTTGSGGQNNLGTVYALLLGEANDIDGTRFSEPSIGSANYVPGPNADEPGFSTTTSSTGGANPLVGVAAVGTERVLSHRSIRATTAFDVIDVRNWNDVVISVDIQVADTTYEAGDFLNVYITDGVRRINVFDQAGTSEVDAIDSMAGRGFLTFTGIVPETWDAARLVIESSTNSSAGAERFDFDNVEFSGIASPVPEPGALTCILSGAVICALSVRFRR